MSCYFTRPSFENMYKYQPFHSSSFSCYKSFFAIFFQNGSHQSRCDKNAAGLYRCFSGFCVCLKTESLSPNVHFLERVKSLQKRYNVSSPLDLLEPIRMSDWHMDDFRLFPSLDSLRKTRRYGAMSFPTLSHTKSSFQKLTRAGLELFKKRQESGTCLLLWLQNLEP